MIREADARRKIATLLEEWGRDLVGGLALVDERTIHKPYGWVFFYASRRYMETRNIVHAIAGNGPVVVLADSGEVVTLGTARRSEEEIASFERARGLYSSMG